MRLAQKKQSTSGVKVMDGVISGDLEDCPAGIVRFRGALALHSGL